jgi:hypothetical protein
VFDVRVQALAFDIGAPNEEQREAGAPAEVSIALTAGTLLPFAQGPGQGPIPMPIANIRFGLTKEDATAYAEKILEAAETLPSSSDLVVAQNLGQADEVAKTIEQFGG